MLISFCFQLESEEEVEEEQEERQPSPEPIQESPNSTYYEAHPVRYGMFFLLLLLLLLFFSFKKLLSDSKIFRLG